MNDDKLFSQTRLVVLKLVVIKKMITYCGAWNKFYILINRKNIVMHLGNC